MGLEQIVFAIFRKIYPVPPLRPGEVPLTPDERRAFGRRTVLLASILVWVIAPLMSFGWYVTLRDAAAYCYPHPPGTIRLVRGSSVLWMLPAMFLGVVSSPRPFYWIVSYLFDCEASRYQRYINERDGYDGERVFRWLSALTLIGSALYFAIGIRTFVRFDQAGMELGRPLRGVTKYYSNQSIVGIEHRQTLRTPSGKLVHQPHYMVIFNDSVEWEIDEIYDLGPGGKPAFADWLATRTGRPVVERP